MQFEALPFEFHPEFVTAGAETERVLSEAAGTAVGPATSPARPLPMVRVANVLLAPYRCICRIVTRAYNKPGNEYSVGTGVLISPYHVLTCAHNIYPLQAPRTRSIDVYPAQNAADDTVVRFRANGWAVSPGWRPGDCRTVGDDYGIIRLATPTRNGFFPLRPFDPAGVIGKTVRLAGYPGDRDRRAQHMYRSAGSVTGAVVIESCGKDTRGNDTLRGRIVPSILPSTSLIAHELAAFHAVSGGPMWMEENGTRTLIGLHARSIDDGKRRAAVLLNDAAHARIAGWLNKEQPALRR